MGERIMHLESMRFQLVQKQALPIMYMKIELTKITIRWQDCIWNEKVISQLIRPDIGALIQ